MATEYAVVEHYAEDGIEDRQTILTMREAKARFNTFAPFIFADDFSECTITFQTQVVTITAIP